jgi:hypothetical protein
VWLTHAKAIAIKELIEGFRTSWRFAVPVVGMGTFMSWFVVRSYVLAVGSDPVMLKVAASMSIIYMGLLVIPFMSNGYLVRSLIEERQKQSILALLATGVAPHVMWLAKLVAAFVLSYLVMLVSLGIHLVVTWLYWHVTPVFTAQSVVGALVVSPLLALALSALMGFLFWYFPYPQIVGMIVPLLVAMVSWNYAWKTPGAGILQDVTLVSIIAPVVIIAAAAVLISRTSRQKVAGL